MVKIILLNKHAVFAGGLPVYAMLIVRDHKVHLTILPMSLQNLSQVSSSRIVASSPRIKNLC